MRWMLVCVGVVASTTLLQGQTVPGVRNALGVRLVVAEEDTQPALNVVLPDGLGVVMKVVFPEHVTVRRRGGTEGERLYLYQPGKSGARPAWRTVGQSIEYERDLEQGVHMLARATMQEDGVLFHYELRNGSNADYEMALAITDPRMVSTLHDVRLERTYVHHKEGFELDRKSVV